MGFLAKRTRNSFQGKVLRLGPEMHQVALEFTTKGSVYNKVKGSPLFKT